MKRLFILGLIFGMLLPLAFAAGNPDAQHGVNANEGQQIEQTTQVMNQEESSQIQVQEQTQLKEGSYNTAGGQQVQIQQQSRNQIRIMSNGTSAQTNMQMTQTQAQNGTRLMAHLSNGKNAEIKIMPDTASQKAMERLRLRVCTPENNCTLELKEVGQGEQTRAAYEIKAQKQVRVLGLFKARMQVQAQIDAENGETIQTKAPWWSFLAVED